MHFSQSSDMSFKKVCLKICQQIPSFPTQAGVYFKEIVGFMVKTKKINFLIKVYFSKAHKLKRINFL